MSKTRGRSKRSPHHNDNDVEVHYIPPGRDASCPSGGWIVNTAETKLFLCGSSSMDAGTGVVAGRSADALFVAKAAEGGQFEVDKSRLVVQRLNRVPQVVNGNEAYAQFQGLAQRILQDHMQANTQLLSLARQKGFHPGRVTLTPEHRQQLAQLRSAPVDQLAILYHAIQVPAHQEAITLFETQAQTGADADLRALASKTLPVLQEHLQMVQQLPELLQR